MAEEARRNLVAKAPGVAGIKLAETVPDAVLELPEKDRPVLAAAMRLDCEALLTGDRAHFGAVYGKTLGGVAIHSPRSLAEALLL